VKERESTIHLVEIRLLKTLRIGKEKLRNRKSNSKEVKNKSMLDNIKVWEDNDS